jgi:hypothetical protein
VSTRKKSNRSQVVGLVGVGLDSEDGHKRITRSEHFLLLGGSEETHARMQDTVLRFDEALEQRGKRLREASLHEIIALLQQALEKSHP